MTSFRKTFKADASPPPLQDRKESKRSQPQTQKAGQEEPKVQETQGGSDTQCVPVQRGYIKRSRSCQKA